MYVCMYARMYVCTYVQYVYCAQDTWPSHAYDTGGSVGAACMTYAYFDPLGKLFPRPAPSEAAFQAKPHTQREARSNS